MDWVTLPPGTVIDAYAVDGQTLVVRFASVTPDGHAQECESNTYHEVPPGWISAIQAAPFVDEVVDGDEIPCKAKVIFEMHRDGVNFTAKARA